MLAGPWAGQMLADMGADVIKIEPPTGDDTRRWGPPFAGDDAAYFLGINRNKRSLTLNMAVAEGQNILAGLIAPGTTIVVTPDSLKDGETGTALTVMEGDPSEKQ